MPKRKRAFHGGTSSPDHPEDRKSTEDSPIDRKVNQDRGLPSGPYATVAQAADVLHVHPKTVRSRIKSGDLEAYRHGRRILIPLTGLLRFVEEGRL